MSWYRLAQTFCEQFYLVNWLFQYFSRNFFHSVLVPLKRLQSVSNIRPPCSINKVTTASDPTICRCFTIFEQNDDYLVLETRDSKQRPHKWNTLEKAKLIQATLKTRGVLGCHFPYFHLENPLICFFRNCLCYQHSTHNFYLS